MRIKLAAAAAALLSFAGSAHAVPTIWAVDASATGSGVSNAAYAEQFSLGGELIRQVNLGSGFNPTGIAVVNGTAYVSSDSDGVIRTFNTYTGALGPLITTGQNALGALTSNGSSLFASDFTGGNLVYQFNFAGGLIGSFAASGCGSYCNGLEYLPNTLPGGSFLVNRGQNVGPYDLYDTTGALSLGSALSIGDEGAVAGNPTGAVIYAAVSGGNGGVATSDNTFIAFGGTPIDTGFGTARYINDLAVDLPEPGTVTLLAAALGLAGFRRRRG